MTLRFFLLLVSDLFLIPQCLPEHFPSSYLIPHWEQSVLGVTYTSGNVLGFGQLRVQRLVKL